MKRLRYRNGSVDNIDAQILGALAANARLSLAELSRQVGLSSPGVSERIKRLEESGVIKGYTVKIDPSLLGRPIAVWLRISPAPGQLAKVSAVLKETKDIVQCDRITGEDCLLARAHVANVEDLEKLIDKFVPYASTNTSLIQSSPVKPRQPPLVAV